MIGSEKLRWRGIRLRISQILYGVPNGTPLACGFRTEAPILPSAQVIAGEDISIRSSGTANA